MTEIATINTKRLVMTIRADLERAMGLEAALIAAAVDKAVIDQAAQTKAQARVLASGVFGPRVANTITSKVWSHQIDATTKPGEARGSIRSRWLRKTGSKLSDIWHAYEHGATIRPVLGKYLFINLRGAGRKWQSFKRADGTRVALRKDSDWKAKKGQFARIPLGQGNLLITRRGRKGQPFVPEALLLDHVTVRKRIDFESVRQDAEKGLYERALAYLNRRPSV